VETRTPGYLLHVEPEELDLARFERLASDGNGDDPQTAASALAEALALWRGRPLADFAYDSFAQGEIARLAELRLAATEQRIDAELRSAGMLSWSASLRRSWPSIPCASASLAS
jgi:hypothetical protein